MKERPILFSGAMVRAILSGRKTQTRRVVKHQDRLRYAPFEKNENDSAGLMDYNPEHWIMPYKDGWHECLGRDSFDGINVRPLPCPYGEPGDRLWVKETHFEARKWRHAPLFAAAPEFIYRADYEYREELRSVIGCHHWRPSIFMKREASRITLEIVSVRVERLQEISEADAVAEGIEPVQMPTGEVMYEDYLEGGALVARAVSSYATLWDRINGAGAFSTNPWGWVVKFKRL